jgi:hypothetical protein
MNGEERLLSLEQAAAACGLDVLVVRHYAELNLIAPVDGYGAAELAELRRARRLMHDLELEPQAIAIIMRMRRRMLALQAELRRLEAELHTARSWSVQEWIDAEWHDV